MAFTNEQKLEFIKFVFKQKIDDVDTLGDMVTLINNMTPANVKAFLNSKLENLQQTYSGKATTATGLASDLEALQTELGSI